MQRIIVIGRAFPQIKTGMHGIFEFEQAESLKERPYQVSYIWCDCRSVRYQRIMKRTFKMHNGVLLCGYNLPIGGIPRPLLWKIRMHFLKKAFMKVIKRNGIPEVVHIHFPLITIDTSFLEYLEMLKCKIVVTEHWSKILKHDISEDQEILLRKIGAQVDRIICVSEELKRAIQYYINITGSTKICVIPNMVSDMFYCPPEAGLEALTPFIFLFSGRLHTDKRCDMLINAFEKAFPNNNEVRLVLAGDGLESNRLNRLKEDYCDSRITFTGYLSREEMPALYRNAAVYVSASPTETFGLPFAEAWMSGIPIICSNTVSILPYVKEMVNGIVFRAEDETSLVSALRSAFLCYDKFDRKVISEYGKKNFGREAVISQISELYDSLFTLGGK